MKVNSLRANASHRAWDPLGEPYWSYPADDLFVALHSSNEGLTSAEAQQRLIVYGANTIRQHRRSGPLGLLLAQFKSPLVLILIVAAVLSLFMGEWLDAEIMLLIVVSSAVLGFVQEYRAGNATERLRRRLTLKSVVVRDGVSQSIPAEAVTPGDVALLSAGSLIPADSVVIEANDFFVNQAVLTGETFPVEKKPGLASAAASLADRTNCVFKGTSVRSGSARVLVINTGKSTVFGQVSERLALRAPETEFERGIRQFSGMMTQLLALLVLVVFAVNVIMRGAAVESLLFAVALAVGMTPELLPAIIAVTLSRGAQQMARRGVIVRRLAAIENLGSMDVLCTDKTGTLTLGVVSLDGALGPDGKPSEAVHRWAYLNAHFQTGLTNPLDEAIVAAPPPGVTGWIKTKEIPYDFVRKRLSVAVQDMTSDGVPTHLVTKGALDSVLAVCDSVEDADRTVKPLDDRRRGALRELFAGWSERGFRVLGVAVRKVALQAEYSEADEVDMCFVGFLLFFDPPKPDARQTIADLKQLGVELKIITGDNRRVALHLAETVGLEVEGVLTGSELAQLRDEALWHLAERTTLFAEVDPNEKERIISALRKMGHVVGYLGDGINDAPALHAADVGISVESAVDVAKETADFVLLEHSLGVLRWGIQEGRTTFANSLKYVFATSSANFGNVFSMAGLSLFLP
ncbi:MAG: magnesium-translocating P-type ATPase [Actinomycetota bacterium]